ncbi:MAG: hypothetical protein LBB14_01780, partial [Puniceicoccales bacterium]|nr:hypothetical protein [Puniceicoccales bacterium]
MREKYEETFPIYSGGPKNCLFAVIRKFNGIPVPLEHVPRSSFKEGETLDGLVLSEVAAQLLRNLPIFQVLKEASGIHERSIFSGRSTTFFLLAIDIGDGNGSGGSRRLGVKDGRGAAVYVRQRFAVNFIGNAFLE